MVKVIIFASNVFSNSKKSYECFKKGSNLSKKELERINKKYFVPAKKGKYSKKELIKKLASELKTTEKHLLKNAESCGGLLKTNKKVLNLVKKLKKKYKVVAVSNTNPLFASLKKEKEQYKKFDRVFLSYKIKATRPELKFYKEVLKKLKVKGKEFLYIDSKKEMLKPAKKLGMKTIFYRNYPGLAKGLNL